MKRLLHLALFALPLLAVARPADPRPTVVANPDGSKVTVRAFGDEHFNYFTDADATTLYERNYNGFWTPVVRNGRVLKTDFDDINLIRAEQVPMSGLAVSNKARMAELDTYGRTTYPTITKEPIHALVVLLEFPDTPFTVNDPVGTFTRMLNEEGFSDYNAKGSARDYYLASSNGLFDVHFDVAPVVKLKNHHAWYTGWNVDADGNATKPSNYIRHRRVADAIVEAIEQLDPVIDFSKYDLDNNGEIDNIFFFYSGHGQADTADETTIWPHQGSYYNFQLNFNYPELKADGVTMRTYACSNELIGKLPAGEKQPYLDGVGAFCHEYGHVLGLPDLYDTYTEFNYGTKTPKKYDVMDQGSYNDNSTRPPLFSAYEKWVCKWLEYDDMEAGNMYELNTVSVPAKGEVQKAYRMRIPRQGPTLRYWPEYFVFETRTQEGWDTAFPEEGLFVWRINYDQAKWRNNQVNFMGDVNVELMNSTDQTYAFPGGRNVTYSIPGESNEMTFAHSNPSFTIWLTDMEFNKATGNSKFGWNLITERPTDAPVLHEQITAVPDSDNSFYVTWDPVDGATNYLISAVRINSRGLRIPMYDDEPVGNTTKFLFKDLVANTQMKQTFEVFVRAVIHIPSEGVSNTISFIPANEISAVDGIYDDAEAAIFGAEGAIVAPEGAQVFNLGGMEVGKENLPAGVYMVRYAAKTVKVLVR